jgi:hypothetical protein
MRNAPVSSLSSETTTLPTASATLGVGCPAIGFVCMREIRDLRGALGFPVERDLHFDADKPLSAYAAEVREQGRIVT